TDQAFAGTLQRFKRSDDLRANASYFLGTGVLLWVTWQIATIAGIVAGQVIPAWWQLEFVVPLCFLALLVPLLRDRVSIVVPAVVFIGPGILRVDPGNAKLIAALVAGGVAWWKQSAVLTIAVGMSVLWLLRYVVR